MLNIFILGILALAVPVVFLCARLPGWLRAQVVVLPALVSFLLLAFDALPTVLRDGSVAIDFAWFGALGIEFSLRLNGLGIMLALLVTGIGTIILLYAHGYMGKHPQANRLYGFLYLFMFSMAGLAMADHMLVFFIFWELTSVSSYFLIGFQHGDKAARNNALQALLVTGFGGMALLAGFILLAGVGGTWNISELVSSAAEIRSHPRYPAILVLVLLGAFTKSAQFPFHFWLPNAMSAPTPVSAYLHSATMVKAGIFLLFLMLPVLGDTAAWTFTLAITGSITLLTGGLFGLCQHDLKKILAGTTVAVLGLLTLLIGIGTEKDILAALLFLIGHALYKATLFMVAGSIDHEAGSRDTRILGGLYKAMPWTAAAALLAAFSKMGLPPFFGFLGKEYTYKASLASEWEWALTAVLLTGNAIVLALAVKTAILPFWKQNKLHKFESVHEAPWSMRLGPLVLALTGMIIGTMPHLLDPILSSAKSVAMGYAIDTEIKLWQGFNLPLLLSAFTLLAGLSIVASHDWLERIIRRYSPGGFERLYDLLLETTLRFAAWQTRFLQSGYLRNYLLIITTATIALITWKLWRFGGISNLQVTPLSEPGIIGVAALMVLAVGLAVLTSSRLTALLALGMVGYGVAWIFATFSAPDLAITQILVETLTIVLFAWVIFKLPGFRALSSKRTILFDGVISATAGLLVTILVLKSQTLEIGTSISNTLAKWSLPEAHGANVVNVILVDFRALDTWGEICVLTIAAMGVWALASVGKKTTSKVDE